MYSQGSEEATDCLYSLACGPDTRVRRYSSCIVNGVRFHTSERDSRRRTQNCSLSVEGMHKGKEIDFYGILVDIIELQYIMDNMVVLFQCEWFDLEGRRTKMQSDKYFTSIYTGGRWYRDDPFILAVQAKQVYYLEDTKLGKGWQVVQKFEHRHIFDVAEQELVNEDEDELYNSRDHVLQDDTSQRISVQDEYDCSLVRNDVEPSNVRAELIDKVTVNQRHDNDLIQEGPDEEDDTLNNYCTDCSDEENIVLSEDSDLD